MTDATDPGLQKAFQLAKETAAELLPDSYEYRTELVRDEPDAWVVQVDPEERVRGHGAEFIITRDPIRVVETILLQ